jgi:hypothetical protein
MKYVLRVGGIPDGSKPKAGVSVASVEPSSIRRAATALTDADGFATFTANGHWPPFSLNISNQPGGEHGQ